MTDLPPPLLCFGYGYSAAALARRRLAAGGRVIGTTRRPEKAAAMRREGVQPLTPGDPIAPILAERPEIVVSAGPDAEGDPILRAHLGDLIAAPPPRWIGYLSTTGVYGDWRGAWIDEGAARRPSAARGAWRVRAEDAWLALRARRGLPVHVFRLAGIYGPGRGPFSKVRAGTARRVVKPGQVFSRIHVEDIATVLEASIAQPAPGEAYNVCDDHPAPPQDVIAYAAELLGVAPPPAVAYADIADDMTPMARSFYGECKRTSNLKIKRRLGVSLAYPDYRSGLQAVLAAELGSSDAAPR